MTISEWKSLGQFEVFDDHRFFYVKGGSEPVLVLLHGFPTSSWDWFKIWDQLTENFQVIALDFLGFGFSDKPKIDYKISLQADIVEGLLSNLNIDSYHILSHDYGDTVAQELLARHTSSSKINSITFLNGGLFPETHKPRLIQKLMISPIGNLLTPFIKKATLERNMKSIFGLSTPPLQAELDSFWELISVNQGRNVMTRLIRYMDERIKNRERWVGAMQTTNIPLKLICGGFDPISGEHMAKRYEELIPRANITLFEGIGHYPQMEAPDLVLKHFLAFTSSL